MDAVRERTRIDEVVGDYVTLRTAGVGSMKGLCPFHDERTPSFTVRPGVGRYHCFGCGASGDVYAFLMEMDHVGFGDAVERLAGKLGYQLRYEDGSAPDRGTTGRRQRLLEANDAAQAWFRDQIATPAAEVGRQFLTARGFSSNAAEHFGVGFAPPGWDGLLRHLRGRGFRDEELADAGLTSTSGRGPYDRFRGRLIWPIRDITGATVGFGARRLSEDDQGPKYLNTPQTRIYNKSHLLYGLDLAKRDIAKQRQVVIVEGYTDVMAMHVAGVTRAVATCGTAFGAEHLRVLRRLLVADDAHDGEIVFAFDGDAAGQNAALRAFEESQAFTVATQVAVQPDGCDPCELRQRSGDQAVLELVESRRPLLEFVLRATVSRFNTEQADGRVSALRAAAPIVASIRDGYLVGQYVRELAGLLGMDTSDVSGAVRAAARRAQRSGQSASRPPAPAKRPQQQPGDTKQPDGTDRMPMPDPRDPEVRAEQQLLGLALQHPDAARRAGAPDLPSEAFTAPAHRMIWSALSGALSAQPLRPQQSDLVGAVTVAAGAWSGRLIGALAVADLPLRGGEDAAELARRLVVDVRHRHLRRRERELHERAQRLSAAGEMAQADVVFAEAVALTTQRQAASWQDR